VVLDKSELGAEGSVSNVQARLLLWCRRGRRGLARVEFSSDFARRKVIDHLKRELSADKIPVHIIELPQWRSPAEILQYLLQHLEAIDSGVVSVSGFATAFDREVSLSDALRVINFNRENLAKPNLLQIWWMTRRFSGRALHAMPDLNSWFTVRLFLTENVSPQGWSAQQFNALVGNVVGSPIGSAVGSVVGNVVLTSPAEQQHISGDDELAIVENLPKSGAQSFVGRGAELADIHRQLQNHDRTAIAAIVGIGGVGKTELALQYATTYRDSYPGGICWLRARDIDIGTQVIAFAQTRLGLSPRTDLDILTQTHWCWQHWPSPPRAVLLVIDDVNDYERVVPYLPRSNRFKVVITTRLRSLGSDISTLDLDTFSEADAQVLLGNLIGEARILSEERAACQLYKLLGYLPIGIEVVGRYLQHRPDLTLTDFYQTLQQVQGATRSLPPGMTAQASLYAVLGQIWEALTTEAQRLACLLSCFALAPIAWALVEEAWPEPPTEALAQYRDQQLLTFGLLRPAGDSLYQLHPLIYEFLSDQREQTGWGDELKQAYCREMVAVAKTIPQTPISAQVLTLTPTIPHLVEAATTWHHWLTDDDLLWPFVGLDRFYSGQGNYGAAEPWAEMCLSVVRARLGAEHPAVAQSLNNLAYLYDSQGRYSEAEPLLVEALAMSKRLLGAEHPAVAQSLNNLALLYKSQGRYSEAEPLLVEALAMSKRLLGAEHPDVALSLNNLAVLYDSQGRYSEAEPLYGEALAMRKRLLGAEHPAVATSLNNLAALYYSQGRYSEAEPLLVEALAMSKRLLGAEHPAVAQSLNNLAYLYASQGRYSEAEPLLVEALAMRKRLLGAEHPDVAQSLNNLAALYASQGRYSEAEPLLVEALAMSKRLLGAEHPDVARSLNNLAALYKSQGRYSEAEPLLVEALAMRKRLLGAEHPAVATSLNNLALLYASQGRYSEAEPLYGEALAMRKRLLGAEHPDVARSLNNLAALYDAQGRSSEAEPLYQQARAINEALQR
jgi:tetratricopeptide (TPR) repeat protein